MSGGRHIDLVIFDCDSTLSSVEGVDELAARAGIGPRIAALTGEAMAGQIPLEEVYGLRLDLIRPGLADLAWLGRRYCETLVPGAREVVARLRDQGRRIHILSAGFQQAVEVLAGELSIPPSRVHAVPLLLGQDGAYAGFDDAAPPARSGGKAVVAADLVKSADGAVMVGDGATDLEVQREGIPVVGFGGVVAREIVRRKADVWLPGPGLFDLPEVIRELEAG